MAKRGPQKNELLNQAIGVRIQRLRLERRFTLRVLAKRAGLHLNTVNNAERGSGISLFGLCCIAVGLGVGLDALVPLSQTIVKTSKNVLANPPKAAKVVCGTEQLFPDPSPARPASTTTVGTQETEAPSRLYEARSIPKRRPAV